MPFMSKLDLAVEKRETSMFDVWTARHAGGKDVFIESGRWTIIASIRET